MTDAGQPEQSQWPRVCLVSAMVLLTRSSLRWLAALTLVGCASSTDDPQPLIEDELTLDQIVSRAEDGEYADVDDLLAALPAFQKSSLVLMARSASLQKADVEHPRVIMYGPDARLIIAVSTLPDDPRYQTVEMMELDEETGAFDLAAVTFANGEVTVQPASDCNSCHGDHPRPIWAEYPSWPGAFGSEHEELPDQERASLETMRADEGHRFRHFRDYLNDDYQLTERDYYFPNTSFNMELGPRIATSLFERARQSEEYKRWVPALLALSECYSIASPDIAETLDEMRNEVAAAAPRPRDNDREPIYEIWGLDLDSDFGIETVAGGPRTDEGQLALWYSASAYLDNVVEFLVLDELLDQDETLAELFEPVARERANLKKYGWELRGSKRAQFLSGGDSYDVADIDPHRNLMNPLLGEGGAATPERLAYCERLGELWVER